MHDGLHPMHQGVREMCHTRPIVCPNMNTLETSPDTTPSPIDPFGDPVAFLAHGGIEAELVEVISLLPEAA
jgi:hypothetical protein